MDSERKARLRSLLNNADWMNDAISTLVEDEIDGRHRGEEKDLIRAVFREPIKCASAPGEGEAPPLAAIDVVGGCYAVTEISGELPAENLSSVKALPTSARAAYIDPALGKRFATVYIGPRGFCLSIDDKRHYFNVNIRSVISNGKRLPQRGSVARKRVSRALDDRRGLCRV